MQKDADGRFRLLPPAVPGSPTPAPPDFSARWRVVHEPRVAIRAGPSTSAAIIGALRAGSEVVSVAEQGPWIQLGAAHIPRADARTAWMMVDGSELAVDSQGVVLPVGRRLQWVETGCCVFAYWCGLLSNKYSFSLKTS